MTYLPLIFTGVSFGSVSTAAFLFPVTTGTPVVQWIKSVEVDSMMKMLP